LKVYLSGAIRGGRQLQQTYEKMLEFLNKRNHEVLTYHVASEDVLKIEENVSDREIFTQDINWLDSSDMLIAEVSIASLGVGYEIAYALNKGIPVLAVYNENYKPISAMISGNTSPILTVHSYDSVPQLLGRIGTFLDDNSI
jgi:nucleoside 2-deoxyribosyltransferase